MTDTDCVAFLQWALPTLHMRWAGFRKVRRQVCRRIERRICRRIERRMCALECSDVEAYRRYLEAQPTEWWVLDGLCKVTISRFFRDRRVFAHLETEVLPAPAEQARLGEPVIGCAPVGWSVAYGA